MTNVDLGTDDVDNVDDDDNDGEEDTGSQVYSTLTKKRKKLINQYVKLLTYSL